MARPVIRRYANTTTTASATATTIITTDAIPSNSVWTVRVECAIRRTDGGNHGGYLHYAGVVQNNGGTVTLPTLAASVANPTAIFRGYENGFFGGPAIGLAISGTSLLIQALAGDGSAVEWKCHAELVCSS